MKSEHEMHKKDLHAEHARILGDAHQRHSETVDRHARHVSDMKAEHDDHHGKLKYQENLWRQGYKQVKHLRIVKDAFEGSVNNIRKSAAEDRAKRMSDQTKDLSRDSGAALRDVDDSPSRRKDESVGSPVGGVWKH